MLPVFKLFTNGMRFWYFSSSALKSLVTGLLNLSLLLLAVTGFIRWHRAGHGRLLMWLTLFVGYNMLMHSLIIVHSRFYLSAMPLVIVAAVSAFVVPNTRAATGGSTDSREVDR